MHMQRVQLLQHSRVACCPGSCDGCKVGQWDVLHLTGLKLHLLYSDIRAAECDESSTVLCSHSCDQSRQV
jgi:hypothetical protein